MRTSINPDVNVFIRSISNGVEVNYAGHNILTNAGREYFAQSNVYSPGGVRYREDVINYIGFGVGSQPETLNVSRLITPTAYRLNTFLAAVDRGMTSFPLSPSRTTVRLGKLFDLGDISFAGAVELTEIGLFTNGDPTAGFGEGSVNIGMAESESQIPIAYHSFATPIPKNANVQLEVYWELIF